MGITYTCKCCQYSTNLFANYKRHMNSKRHFKAENAKTNIRKKTSKSQPKVNQNSQKIDKKSTEIFVFDENSQPKVSRESTESKPTHQKTNIESLYYCDFCSKEFKHKQSKYRHMKHRCKNRDLMTEYETDEYDLMNKIMQKLNEKGINMDIREIFDDDDSLRGCKNKVITNVHGNINNTVNNTMNFQILNYDKTDYEFLEDQDYIKCIQQNNHCVKELIEKVHFNRNKPENMNIYISSIKGKYVLVYKDDVWQIRNRKKQIDDLYEINEMELEQWFDVYSEKYPHIIKSFERYLKNKEEDDTLIRNIKHEIELMLYNKRGLIPEIE